MREQRVQAEATYPISRATKRIFIDPGRDRLCDVFLPPRQQRTDLPSVPDATATAKAKHLT